MRSTKRFLAPVLMATLLAAVVLHLAASAAERYDTYRWFDPIQDILIALRSGYVEEFDAQRYEKLRVGAIEGMLRSLDDPYTNFIKAEDLEDFDKNVRGHYVGIGAEVRLEDGWLTIITPMAESPALEAGIRAGDQVRKVDGVSTEGEDVNETIRRLMGVPETQVRVTVKRADASEGEFEEIVVTRRAISVRTLRGVHRDGSAWDYWIDRESGLAYFRVSQFTQPTPGEIHKAVTQLLGQGLKGLVLDLRFNPGGSLQSAVQVSDLFLDEGVIVSVRGRGGDTAFTARSPGTLPDFPMVVLLNGHSASASEIVAGALQEADRAVVLGTRSFGKGHVQDVRPLPSGAGHLKMTTANYYLPSGRNIHKSPDSTTWGVDPNPGFFIPLTTAQYNQILRIQRELDIIRDGNDEGEWHDPRWVRERLDDPQLAGAVEALHHHLANGEWQGPGGDLEENEPILDELRLVERTRERLMRQLEQVDDRLEQLLAFVPLEEKEEPRRLIPDGRELAGGLIEVKDADGQIVAVLRVTDPALLEQGLRHAELMPFEEGVTEN